MPRLIKRIAAAIVLLLAAATTAASFYMLHYALDADPDREAKVGEVYRRVYSDFPQLHEWVDSLHRKAALRDTFVVQPSGERHHALYIRAARPTRNVAVLIHGYTSRAQFMLPLACLYSRELGYNVLLPDLHAHGLSEGSRIGMGWNERWDVAHWCAVADSLFNGHGGTHQVVHGVSMGAAVTMFLSGERTPAYIRCFVEDCGYSSVWDEFQFQLKSMFGLPEFPLLWTTSALCRATEGWSFGEASAVSAVARSTKPMLFIHGDADNYVPTRMSRQLYAAKAGAKQLWIAPGSGHARSLKDHPRQYASRLCAFLRKYM